MACACRLAPSRATRHPGTSARRASGLI
jgi:hypothetical protein